MQKLIAKISEKRTKIIEKILEKVTGGRISAEDFYTAEVSFISCFLWSWITSQRWWIAIVAAILPLINSVLVQKRNGKVISASVIIGSGVVTSLIAGEFWTTLAAFAATAVVRLLFRKKKHLREFCAGSIIPVAIVLYIEFLQYNFKGALSRYFVTPYFSEHCGYVIATFVIIAITATLYLLVNSKKIAYWVSGTVLAIFGLANYFIITITEQPFLPTDFAIATTAAGVIKSQHLEPKDWIRPIVAVVLLVLYWILIGYIYREKQEKRSFKIRIPAIAGMCALFVMIGYLGSALYSTLLLYSGNIKYSFVTNYIMNMYSGINIPDDAAEYRFEDISEESDYKPNVIIIMNEAFSDLEGTFGIKCNEEVLPYFHSLQKDYPSGVAYTSVRGNNTCSSEWEILSGVSTALTAKGAMVFKDNCKPMNTLVSLFNSRGYTTYGLHPYYGFGYNRLNMYNALGFDKTVFLEDMDENSLDRIRDYVSDEQDYRYLISLYEENEKQGDAPFFCFNVTMQNHAGYSEGLSDIHTTSAGTHDDVNTYLSILKNSDEALKTLISYFEGVDEDTIILFFGDHQPMVRDEFYEDIYDTDYQDLELDQLKEVYAVPYLIWANYDLNKDVSAPAVSVNYLSSVLFEVGNIPKSTWTTRLAEYRKQFPIITTIFTENSHGMRDYTSSVLPSVKNADKDNELYTLYLYQKYCYGILLGNK